MRARWLLAGVVALAAWLPGAPALAWGSYTHGLIAARAFDQLVPQHPWLAAHREAYMWGTIAPDHAGCRDDHRQGLAHTSGTLASLWREAEAKDDQGARAFVLGWAVHLAADEVEEGAFTGRWRAFSEALDAAGAPPPQAIAPLVDWAVDAALAPVADGTLADMFYAAALQVGTPASAPLREMLRRVLAIDETAYLGFARHQAAMSAGGFDRYLAFRSRSLQLAPWEAQLRQPAVRLALGELRPLVTQAVNRGISRAEALLGSPEAGGSRRPGRT